MNIKKLALNLLLPLVSVCITQSATAITITFDDIASNEVGTIADGYSGLNWDNFGYSDDNFEIGSGYNNGVVSGHYTAFNEYGDPASVSSSSLFDFNSAYLTSAWNTGLNVTIEGWFGSSLLYTDTVVVDTTGSTLFNFDFIGIDSLVFNSFGGVNVDALDYTGEQFVMDNMTITMSSVPEPGMLVLLSIGLLSLVVVKRRSI